jgi:hypothetical protein
MIAWDKRCGFGFFTIHDIPGRCELSYQTEGVGVSSDQLSARAEVYLVWRMAVIIVIRYVDDGIYRVLRSDSLVQIPAPSIPS